MNLIQMSAAGSCIILATVMVRTLAIHKLPKRTFLILWGIAFVRLVFPFSIPASFSLFALLRRSAPVAVRMEAAPIVARDAGTAGEALQTLARNHAAIQTAASGANVSVWTAIWLAGAGVCALLFAASYVRWYKHFRASTPVDNAFANEWLKTHTLRRPVSIRQMDGITAPLTYGIFRPVILVPERMDWADEQILNYVFAHEFTHIRRFDALTKLALALAPCVHWFNPLVWVMYVLANRDIEIACDEAVIRSIGPDTRKAYALALLDLAEGRNGLAVLTNGFSRNAIEERIRAIMKMRKVKLPAIVLTIVLAIGMATAFATSAPAEEDAIENTGAATSYSIYEPYGLRYDAENDCYTYNGSIVGFFNDPIGGTSFTNYFSGEIELEAEYDENGALAGIRECSPETYARHAEKRARIAKRSARSDGAEESTHATAQPDELKWLKAYEPFGIVYSADQNRLTYFGQTVKTLIDSRESAVYRSDLGEINLVILRDEKGIVCAVDACTEEQAQAMLQALDPQGEELAVEATANEPALDEAAMTETALRRAEEHYPELGEWLRTQYPDAVWWTVEDYSAWMSQEEARLREQLGKTVGWNSAGEVTVNQEYIDEMQANHQETLRLLAEGWLVSKSMDGDENIGTAINPVDWANGRAREFELVVQMKDGTEAHMGPYETADELLEAFIPFSEQQIAAGNLDSGEADEIIEYYRSRAN